jgi:hypothetical protein
VDRNACVVKVDMLVESRKIFRVIYILFSPSLVTCSVRFIPFNFLIMMIGEICKPVYFSNMRRLTTGIHSEKCVVRRFCRCTNVIECSYTNLDSMAYYTIRLYVLTYCSWAIKPVQHVTVLNTVGSCNTMVNIVILYSYYVLL